MPNEKEEEKKKRQEKEDKERLEREKKRTEYFQNLKSKNPHTTILKKESFVEKEHEEEFLKTIETLRSCLNSFFSCGLDPRKAVKNLETLCRVGDSESILNIVKSDCVRRK